MAATAIGLVLANSAFAAPRPPKPAEVTAYLADKPAKLQPMFRSAIMEGERNRVLNLDRAGLAALEMGDDAVAAASLDQALERIEAIYANNPKAVKARSKFVKEATKDFKGEPYERAMAFYYRGVVYLRAGDYENARASFQQGQLQDAMAEDQQYKSDYASFEVLSGWASQCLGDMSRAEDFYAAAKALRSDVVVPGPQDKVLLLADMGLGPQKYADGQYMENLRFRGQTYDEQRVAFMSAAAERGMLLKARAAIAKREAAEAEGRGLTTAVNDLTQKATATRAMADATAKAIEARMTAPPPASATAEAAVVTPVSYVAGELPVETAPAPPKPKTAAERAAEQRATRERDAAAQVAAQAAALEQTTYETIALKAALDADAVEVELRETRGQLAEAQKTLAAARVTERNAMAALTPYGLTPAAAASLAAADEIPEAPVQVATRGESVLLQASTRGGRLIDGVLAGKAAFKTGATEFSNNMSEASMIAIQTTSTMADTATSLINQGYSVNTGAIEGMAYAGLAFAAIGALSSMAASAAKPQADIRYWDSLPGELHYATAPSGDGFKAVFQRGNGQFIRTADVVTKGDSGGKCSIGWVRSRSAVDVPASAPNAVEPTK